MQRGAIMQHRILLGCAFLYLTVSNVIWIAWDTRPAFWDMAVHQTGALRILYAIGERGLMGITALPYATQPYPPLFHSVVAVFFTVFGVSPDAAQLANIPATAILLGSTYWIGKRLMSATAGAIAATLVGFYPLMIWLSREALIDYWLTAMVALAFAVLLETDRFSNRRMAVLFGIVCGLGMLTKWTFVVFLLFPTLWFAWRRIEHAVLAGAVAAGVASLWYIPQLDILGEFLALNTAGGVSEGDPFRLSWQAIIFYVRALEGYQLFLPLFVLFVAGLIRTLKGFDAKWVPVWLWLGGAWFCLLFFVNKDPRYSVPLLPAVALVTASLFVSTPARTGIGTKIRKGAMFCLIPFLLFQHYMISFGVGALPQSVVLVEGVDGPLRWDWYLYSQRYFDLWGPPLREDWKIEYVLDRVTDQPVRLGDAERPIRLGMVPDIPRFDAAAFQFYILARNDPVEMWRLTSADPATLGSADYILLSETAQGYAGLVPQGLDAVGQFVLDNPQDFESLESFALPNGEVIRLVRVGS
jgi:4-amino-4-deoxy-L-arabinose transferase-like glycosyltransferase